MTRIGGTLGEHFDLRVKPGRARTPRSTRRLPPSADHHTGSAPPLDLLRKPRLTSDITDKTPLTG